jgi:hypothetical protein
MVLLANRPDNRQLPADKDRQKLEELEEQVREKDKKIS